MKKQNLKVGQQYRVIKDSYDEIEPNSIVTVKVVIFNDMFRDTDDYCWDLSRDELELITPKKEVKKYTHTICPLCNGKKILSKKKLKMFEDLLATKQEDKKEIKTMDDINIYLANQKKKTSPSLLNDIETIEEIKHELWRFPLDKRSQELKVGEHQHKVIVAIDKKINSLIKNQRIHTEIIKSLMEKKNDI